MNVVFFAEVTQIWDGRNKLGVATKTLTLDNESEITLPTLFYISLGEPLVGSKLAITVSTKQSESSLQPNAYKEERTDQLPRLGIAPQEPY